MPGGIISLLSIIFFASAILFKIAYRNEGYGSYIVYENQSPQQNIQGGRLL